MLFPKEYENRMKEMLRGGYDEYLASFEDKAYQGLRLNTMKIDLDDFNRLFGKELDNVPWCDHGFYYEDDDKPSKNPMYYAGLYYIQEPSAMTTACFLPVDKGDRVLDLCAAPGGKSTELAAKLDGTGLLVSNDISASRAKALLKNLEVFGAPNILITSENPHVLSERFEHFFDKILIDAPCSGEGMFRKQNNMIKAWEENGTQLFVDIQKTILKDAVSMLRPGGMIIYSTCTFSPEEDEESIEYLLSLDDNLKLIELPMYEGYDKGHPEWGKTGSVELEKARRLWPHKVKGEGHFVALIKHDGDDDISRMNNYTGSSYSFGKEKLSDEAKEFLSHTTFDFDGGSFDIQKGRVFYIPDTMPDIKGLRILRCGLLVGEIKKNRFEPSQAFAMALKSNEYDNCLMLEKDDARLVKYLKGETIDVSPLEEKGLYEGYVLICLDKYPLGFGKLKNGSIKNKYLAGWRMMS